MKSFIKNVADALGVFSPIIILIFVCCAYLYKPATEKEKNNIESVQDSTKQKSPKPFL